MRIAIVCWEPLPMVTATRTGRLSPGNRAAPAVWSKFMNLGNGLGHLTYSTLVHPGDTWDEMWHSLTTFVPKVKARIAPKERFGISLRLAAASAERLVHDKKEREKLKKFLADNDMYLYTVNAFPYGPFKGQRV